MAEADFPAGATLIFGGSGGSGRGVASCFTRAGSDIALCYRSRREAAEEVAAGLEAAGARVTLHQVDVTTEYQVCATVLAAVEAHGRVTPWSGAPAPWSTGST